MHGLLCLNPVEKYFNYNYNELLPILVEKIMAYKLDNELKEDALLKTQIIRMKHLQDSIKEYNYIMPLFPELDKDNKSLPVELLALKYSFYNSYGYSVSSIYADQLFNYYLENPKDITTKIENLIERKETIPEVLKELNISLGDNTTFNSFQKTLKQVSK